MMHFPEWFVDVYAVAFCAVFILAFTLGVVALLLGLCRAVAWAAVLLLKDSKDVKLLVAAVWWRAMRSDVPRRLVLEAVREQARGSIFREQFARVLREAGAAAQEARK